MIEVWTDYPLYGTDLIRASVAPIRRVRVLRLDGDKYAIVEHRGLEFEVKTGYLYSERGRCGDVPVADLSAIPAPPPKEER